MNLTRRKPVRTTGLVAALTALGLLAAACTGGDGGEDGSTSSSHTSASSSTATTGSEESSSPEPTTPPAEETTRKQTSPAAKAPTTTAGDEAKAMAGSQPLDVFSQRGSLFDVVDVRAAGHGDFDRFVVELEGNGKPGWYVRLTDEPLGMGSGLPLEYEGEQALQVTVRGVKAPLRADGTVRPKLEAPPVGPHNKSIVSIQSEGWFEGDQNFLLGLNKRNAKFKVNLLENPNRLVIDIMH